MKKISNKGFTLIELIATLVILTLVMGLGAYTITNLINNSKEKNYQLLVKEIRNAAELYYQECRYSDADNNTCYYDFDFDNDLDNDDLKYYVENENVTLPTDASLNYLYDLINNYGLTKEEIEGHMNREINYSNITKDIIYTKLNKLVYYGFLNDNDKDDEGVSRLLNVRTGEAIDDCIIAIGFGGEDFYDLAINEGTDNPYKLYVLSINTGNSHCPTSCDYNPGSTFASCET